MTTAFEAVMGLFNRRSPTTPVPPAADRIVFDPSGPEKAGSDAVDYFNSGHYQPAFRAAVRAVDKLHDFYVYEQFRNRQPGPADTWIITALTQSLEAVRSANGSADVRDGVREATHRLRTISSSIDESGGNSTLYRAALDDMARSARDVDVSDIYWD